MAARTVTQAFELNQADGTKVFFAVGDQVEGEHAEHWYVQAHSEAVDEKIVKGKGKAADPKADE